MAYVQHGQNALRKATNGCANLKYSCCAIHPLLFACHGVRFRKMEVILTSKINKLGGAGETVKVAPGYFRNHLMPKLLAVPKIDRFSHLVKEQRKIYRVEEEKEVEVEEREEDKMKEHEKAAIRLDRAQLTIRAGVDAHKFSARLRNDEPIPILSPVTKEHLVKEVARQLDVQIQPENIHLPTPLTSLGEFQIPLRLPKSLSLPAGKVRWTLSVKIRGK